MLKAVAFELSSISQDTVSDVDEGVAVKWSLAD